ncbi:hypothetical protein SB783_29440 [Paraburkholderia sp. SIMBA_009]
MDNTATWGAACAMHDAPYLDDLLAAVSPPGKACFYCERDRYRDIDHVRPKRHYPEQCFVWGNYIYACTICNQDYKKDTYAVFDITGAIVKFDRSLPFSSLVPAGDHVLIDPRSEDPLNFLRLDLSTGRFTAIGNARSVLRGEFTRELFDLNETTLARIRVAAYETFKHYLMKFQVANQANDNAATQRVLNEIRDLPHPTVLVEMRLQSANDVMLAAHFINVPADIGQRP